MSEFYDKRPGPGFHAGVALLTGLVMLAAISLLALVATASMILQQRMAGNFADHERARKGAASATSSAEQFLFSLSPDQRMAGCRHDCYSFALGTVIRPEDALTQTPEYESAAWWQTWGFEAGQNPMGEAPIDDASVTTPEPPRFLIAELHFSAAEDLAAGDGAPPLDGIAYYRVLGRGSGRGPAAVVVNELIVARPWLGDASSDYPGTNKDDVCAIYGEWYDCGQLAWRQRR